MFTAAAYADANAIERFQRGVGASEPFVRWLAASLRRP